MQCTLKAHLMFPLFPEVFSISLWYKTFKKCNLPDFKFYLSKLNNKKFPHMVKRRENRPKINITPYGENSY